MTFIRSFAALSLFILMGAQAHAAVSDGTEISSATMAPLASWVEQATQVPLQILPVAIASDRKLEKALHVEDVQRAGAVGAYLPGRIVISNAVWDTASVQAQSYLVHELVHHAQLVSGRAYACHAAKEREAYMLQSRWLIEHGQKPIVTQAWIDSISSCSAKANAGHAD